LIRCCAHHNDCDIQDTTVKQQEEQHEQQEEPTRRIRRTTEPNKHVALMNEAFYRLERQTNWRWEFHINGPSKERFFLIPCCAHHHDSGSRLNAMTRNRT